MNINSEEDAVQQNHVGQEEIDNFSDLEREKQNSNEFKVQDNVAYTQIFIQSASGLNIGYRKAEEKKGTIKPEKVFDLRKPDECTSFVEKYRAGEYLAVAIILSTFEAVAVCDLPDLKKVLMECIPKARVFVGEDVRDEDPITDPYISLNTMLSVVGGQRFVTENGLICISLGENSEAALVNILEQFPALRSSIIEWLVRVNEMDQHRTAFAAYQIAMAFIRMISIDIGYARRSILPELYTNSDNVGLLANLAYKLYGNIALREEVKEIVLDWMEAEEIWLWRSACLTYSFLEKEMCGNWLERQMERTLRKKLLYLKREDLKFVASILMESKGFRNIITSVFKKVSERTDDRKKHQILSQVYINLVRYSYYQVNAGLTELPLVACDTKQQQHNLTMVLARIMPVYHLRKQMYAILEAYLKELSRYAFTETVIKHIAAYFCNLAGDSAEYHRDILYLLEKCQNKAALRIYELLCHA